MTSVLAMNGAFDASYELLDSGFGDFGATVSQNITQLQIALRELGTLVRDGTLTALVVDGLIGPKTTAASNLAMTQYIAPGNAGAALRTGQLSQDRVIMFAKALIDATRAEIARRAAKPVVGPVVPPSIAPPSEQPAYYTPSEPSASFIPENMVKWAVIGLGVVVAGGVAYYLLTRGRAAPSLSRPALRGAADFYNDKPSDFRSGDRVMLHPGTDAWMRGDKYGDVTRIGKKHVHVKMDVSGRTLKVAPSRLAIVD